MDYNVFYWGPLLFRTIVEDTDLIEVGKLCKKEFSNNHNLAGHLEEQFKIDNNKLENILKKYLNVFEKASSIYYNKKLNFNINVSWVNFMKKGDFNPPHIHSDDFSAVLFLSVPEEIKKENENFKGNGTVFEGPGAITFLYGLELDNFVTKYDLFPTRGELYIFPAKLYHFVSPFKSDVERISVAFNLEKIKS